MNKLLKIIYGIITVCIFSNQVYSQSSDCFELKASKRVLHSLNDTVTYSLAIKSDSFQSIYFPYKVFSPTRMTIDLDKIDTIKEYISKYLNGDSISVNSSQLLIESANSIYHFANGCFVVLDSSNYSKYYYQYYRYEYKHYILTKNSSLSFNISFNKPDLKNKVNSKKIRFIMILDDIYADIIQDNTDIILVSNWVKI